MKTPPKAPASLLAHQIVSAAASSEVTIGELARLAEGDPAFAMRVLRIVNSAAFGLQRSVDSIRQACAMIGTRGLRSVALGLLVSDMAPLGRDGAIVLAQVLRRAAAGGMVAATCGVPPDEGFLVGLLLEVGILSRLRDDPRAAEIIQTPASHRIAAELAAGLRAHSEVGAELVVSFGLSPEIADAIAGHHDTLPRTGARAHVAWAVERVAAVWESDDVEGSIDVATSSLCTIGFDRPGADLVLERLPSVVADAASAFGLVIKTPEQLESLRQDATRALVELNEGYILNVRRLEAQLQEQERLSAELGRANAELRLAATNPPSALRPSSSPASRAPTLVSVRTGTG